MLCCNACGRCRACSVWDPASKNETLLSDDRLRELMGCGIAGIHGAGKMAIFEREVA